MSLITIIDVVSRLKVESYPCLDMTNPPLAAYQLMLRRAFLTTGLPRQISFDHGTVFYDNTSPSECGQVVPVANLVPSTRLHIIENGVEIGQEPVAQTYHAVLTQRLKAGSQVYAVEIACEGTDHEIRGPQSDFANPPPLAAPVPPPAPAVDKASLIPGTIL